MENHHPGGDSLEPTFSRTPCPTCASTDVGVSTLAGRVVYLRCRACYAAWSMPERRRDGVRRLVQGRVTETAPEIEPL
jgi:hypothetical protein